MYPIHQVILQSEKEIPVRTYFSNSYNRETNVFNQKYGNSPSFYRRSRTFDTVSQKDSTIFSKIPLLKNKDKQKSLNK